MSSYLSFYVVPKRKTKEEPKQYIILCSYSRNSDIYSYFNDNLNVAYAGNDEKYTTITKDDINVVLKDFEEGIKANTIKLAEYEKYVSANPDYIQDILELKSEISNLAYWRDKTSFIADIIDELNYQYSNGIEEVCCNID